jgi:alkyl sulfatase BDS1-like metallo-beta-lactamase superfamily hydrolase
MGKPGSALLIGLCLLGAACGEEPAAPGKKSLGPLMPAPALDAHSALFRRGVEKVAENVYVAIGFGLANSILIEGGEGLLVVDTMESVEAAEAVLAEFRKISAKPVKAIVYTHNHVDHIFGASVFAGQDAPAVYAHETTAAHVGSLVNEFGPAIGMRSARMFGSFLEDNALVNAGIGGFLAAGTRTRVGYLPPTQTFSESLAVEAAGVRFELIHAPGETDDQAVVWLPEQRILLAADNFYWAFPNLYTIRGTPFRSLKQWYQSIDRMRAKKARVLIPSHTRPVIGEENVERVLTDYRDAIQFVHDQSIRGMNMGLTADELVEYVRLPAHLAAAPCLQPFYGTVAWSVRSMFAGSLGWFDGDSANIDPLTRRGQAELMAWVAGGEARLLERAGQALADGRFQAALKLTGDLVHLNPDNEEAKRLRVKALVALGERQANPNARHYYLTEAVEIRDGFIARTGGKPDPQLLRRLPLGGFFDAMAVNLDPAASREVDRKAGLVFPGEGRAFLIHVRRGVAEIREVPVAEAEAAAADFIVRADSALWKEMLAKMRSPLTTLPRFEYLKGHSIGFARFLKLFAAPEPKLPYAPVRE